MMQWDQCPAILAGLIGAGIGGSHTPAMHEREAAQAGLRLTYRRIDLDALRLGPEALPDLLRAAEWMGFSGLNITFPCKQTVVPLLDALSPEAEALGAVNTVVLRDGQRIGHNTDMSGFAEAFRRGLPDVARRRVVQIGAGGAGAAVAHALLSEGVECLVVSDAEEARARALAQLLRDRFGADRALACADLVSAIAQADGVVNCTPIGMAKLPGSPVPADLLRPTLWAADIVYVPIETEFLCNARAVGCRTLDGGGMAVFQAAGAFRLFTGREPDAARMQCHFAELSAPAYSPGRT